MAVRVYCAGGYAVSTLALQVRLERSVDRGRLVNRAHVGGIKDRVRSGS